MNGTAERFEGRRIEYEWGGYHWAAVAIGRADVADVWISSAEVERDQARYAFSMRCDEGYGISKATITAHAGAIDAMFKLGDEYLLDIDEYGDFEDDLDEQQKEAEDEVFRFELGPLSVKASMAKAG